VRATVRAADAVDRVQRREYQQHQDGREPHHKVDYKVAFSAIRELAVTDDRRSSFRCGPRTHLK
jgi:hypothetical protein